MIQIQFTFIDLQPAIRATMVTGVHSHVTAYMDSVTPLKAGVSVTQATRVNAVKLVSTCMKCSLMVLC